jgi:uncharacterized protein YjbI with pentapeptide repeats
LQDEIFCANLSALFPIDWSCPMKLYESKERLDIRKSDVSGSVFSNVNISGATFENVNISGASFDDVNLSGWRIHDANLSGLRITKANLAGATITESRLEGMTIDGIAVTEMLAAYRAAQETVKT